MTRTPDEIRAGMAPLEPIDLTEIDPGIREFVRFLRAHSFDTTDSGDGVSKEPEARALDFTHVAISIDPVWLCQEADRLQRLLQLHGLEPQPLGPEAPCALAIEASYQPGGAALILVSYIPINWKPA